MRAKILEEMDAFKNQDSFTKENLEDALRAITSLIGKCEKVEERLTPGTAQHTLIKNRLKAFYVSVSLITKALEGVSNE